MFTLSSSEFFQEFSWSMFTALSVPGGSASTAEGNVCMHFAGLLACCTWNPATRPWVGLAGETHNRFFTALLLKSQLLLVTSWMHKAKAFNGWKEWDNKALIFFFLIDVLILIEVTICHTSVGRCSPRQCSIVFTVFTNIDIPSSAWGNTCRDQGAAVMQLPSVPTLSRGVWPKIFFWDELGMAQNQQYYIVLLSFKLSKDME